MRRLTETTGATYVQCIPLHYPLNQCTICHNYICCDLCVTGKWMPFLLWLLLKIPSAVHHLVGKKSASSVATQSPEVTAAFMLRWSN